MPSEFSLWQVLVLAVVQGITEFLPISSDGHLVLVAPLLFGNSQVPEMLDLTIGLHMGTLGSILVFYRQRIARLFTSDRRVAGLIVLGTIPAVALVLIAKLLLKSWFEPILQDTLLAGFMLPVTGIALLYSLHTATGSRDYRELTAGQSLLIGIAQAFAILPGLSRSGSTISSGLLLGMSRSAAATYSFLLAIPALVGAAVYEGFSMLKDGTPLSTSPGNLAIGALVSFVVGLGALSFLDRLLQRGRLHYFGWYCIALGIFVIAWQLRLRFN
jgi:undecaprenyl-diphosphatase